MRCIETGKEEKQGNAIQRLIVTWDVLKQIPRLESKSEKPD